MIRIPYFNFLKVNEVPEELWNDIFYRLFNHEVIISDNKIFDLNGPPRNLLCLNFRLNHQVVGLFTKSLYRCSTKHLKKNLYL